MAAPILNSRIRSLRDEDHQHLLQTCTHSLKSGHVIAVPTDTIYGITCLAQSCGGVEQLYEIKKRNPLKPIAICVGDVEIIQKWCQVNISEDLLRELLPGPVTLVFRRTKLLNGRLNPDTPLVGVRVPDNHFIRQLSRSCDEPLALTSANSSNTPSSLNIAEFRNLWDMLDVIVDGGQSEMKDESRLGSTVIDCSTEGKYRILRDGSAKQDTVNKLKRYGLMYDSD